MDDSFAPGIGRRLDGRPNRDLNVGAIVSLAPNKKPLTDLLGVDVPTVDKVLAAWGPGKFDAELFLDGKGFRPDGKTAAMLIPPAFGLAGVNLHTYTGWGSVTYWNAFVANLEMHGKGNFVDPRLNDAARFPIAVAAGFGRVHNTPDLITSKLAALHAYQLAVDSTDAAEGQLRPRGAQRGKAIFDGIGKCASCHMPPLFTEPGQNLHRPAEVCTDSFQADRSPTGMYRTTPLKGLFSHAKHGFWHDGRFQSPAAVVEHYNSCFRLGLDARQQADLVQYLKSI